MLQRGLFNPLIPERVIEDEVFEKYIEIRNNQEEETDPDLVDNAKRVFMKSHANTDETVLRQNWQAVESLLITNAGLTQFALDFGGCKSDHFFPWLTSVRKSPSEALEMAYGWGRNLEGVFEYAGDDPWYMDAARNLPTLAFHRERQLTVANLITLVKGARREKAKVVDLGAGRMDWARMHGFILEPEIMRIEAFDKDPTIDPYELFRMGGEFAGITYMRHDIAEVLSIMRFLDVADAIIMQGVASYYPIDVLTDILARIYGLLQENGVFFFDLQLDCVYYRWSVVTFGWPEMKLAKNASEAIDLVEGLRKKLWERGCRFSAEYTLNAYSKSPMAVMVTLTKVR